MSKEDIVNLDYKTKKIQLITAIIAFASVVIGIVRTAPILIFIGIAILVVILVTIVAILIIEKFFLPQGVFAVSAIIVNEKMELLLIKDDRDGIYKQPGCHYRTNKLKNKNELEIPYSKILENIEIETGINKTYFKFIDLSNYQHKKEYDLASLIDRDKKYLSIKDKFKKYETNIIMPPPFFIMQENSEPKTSGAKYHIDMFYAFRVNSTEQNNNSNVVFYSENKIHKLIAEDKKEIYPDLLFVFNNFRRIYETTHFPKSYIRLCTFNTSENKSILLWRITQNCNANCDYCLLRTKLQTITKPISIEENVIQTIIDNISENKINKIIISGGEPLLVENLVEIVQKVALETTCDSITICTNGIKLKDEECYNKILKLKEVEKFKKFVISIDHYEENNYKSLKKHKENFRLSDLTESIAKLRDASFDVFINVMATEKFLAAPNKYIDFWRKNNFNKISISYPIKCNNKKKFELKSEYDKIISGHYGDISFLEKEGLELIIPDCQYEHCPHFDNKIYHIDSDGSFSRGCIEKC